eukprot:355731-Chlamydomonas_euryale.AAC.10
MAGHAQRATLTSRCDQSAKRVGRSALAQLQAHTAAPGRMPSSLSGAPPSFPQRCVPGQQDARSQQQQQQRQQLQQRRQQRQRRRQQHRRQREERQQQQQQQRQQLQQQRQQNRQQRQRQRQQLQQQTTVTRRSAAALLPAGIQIVQPQEAPLQHIRTGPHIHTPTAPTLQDALHVAIHAVPHIQMMRVAAGAAARANHVL